MPAYVLVGVLCAASILVGLALMWVNLKSGSNFGKRLSFLLMWLALLAAGVAFVRFFVLVWEAT